MLVFRQTPIVNRNYKYFLVVKYFLRRSKVGKLDPITTVSRSCSDGIEWITCLESLYIGSETNSFQKLYRFASNNFITIV